MTDADGDLVEHYGYYPFGNERFNDPKPAFSVTNRYTGQQLDEETGLYFYGSRYYDPELARFIQPDSVVPGGGSQSLNRYTYCVNNPLKFTDPTGHFIFAVFAAIAAFAAANAATIAYIAGTAFLSGAITAAQGGNFWRGVVSGAASAGFSLIVGPIAGGVLGALVTGGDPGMAAATAGINAGVSIACGINPMPGFGGASAGEFFKGLVLSTGVGALAGGISAEITGGSFGEGAMWGAASAAASFALGRVIGDYLDSLESQGQNQELVLLMCNIDLEIDAYYIEVPIEDLAKIGEIWINEEFGGFITPDDFDEFMQVVLNKAETTSSFDTYYKGTTPMWQNYKWYYDIKNKMLAQGNDINYVGVGAGLAWTPRPIQWGLGHSWKMYNIIYEKINGVQYEGRPYKMMNSREKFYYKYGRKALLYKWGYE